ncbi:hypothetical protein J5N97_027422 [Dioscorea zingiberensis]|uniref:Protein kinase domain-containing protein n=1 Tax=Dioscorea zingiberensis TaxID=325984 RepID=A0A9D5C5A7_9LILI|nr:hypothetical protein J5N97_027422 [Dioscorea zingiberensis]
MSFLHYHLIFFLFPFLTLLATSIDEQELHCLLSFKASADPLNATLQTWSGFNPCSGSWLGVKCNGGRVLSIHLHNSNLTGTLTPILCLNHLQVLDLRSNALTGTLPHLTNFTHPSLKHLLLSHNQLNGTLNISLPSLLSLRLEHNGFSGNLEGLHLPIVKDFNISENNLNGEISGSLPRFSVKAYGGNPSLCGSPLPSCDTPSTSPPVPSLSLAVVLAISAGNLVVITIALVFVLVLYIWLKRKLSKLELNQEEQCPEEKRSNGVGVGLVCFEGGEELRLECLLKASAEVLGKSVAGSSYKAMLDNGLVMAVKRLNASRFINGGKGFDKRVHLVGRVRHPHVVSLRACYNGNEEKLLVYDFMPNGNLQSLLQNLGTRGLEWRRRKEILMGAAHGLSFIHNFPARSPLVHGNIKPSNILIDEQGNACISEWGLMCYLTSNMSQCFPSHSSHLFSGSMHRHGYRAPELMSGKVKATQASDVYSFGMVLLEVVTDEEIDARECEGELMGMVKVGMLCTNECPDERPTMNEVRNAATSVIKEATAVAGTESVVAPEVGLGAGASAAAAFSNIEEATITTIMATTKSLNLRADSIGRREAVAVDRGTRRL